MVMAWVALLGAISTFAVMRKNPALTARYVLRFVVFLGAIGGMFGLTLPLAIRLTQHRSQWVQLAAVLGVVAVIILVMIVLSEVLFLPNVPPLPASARRLHVFQRRTYVWARRLGWSLLAFAVLLLVLPGSARLVVAAVGGLFAFLATALMFAVWLTARRTDGWLSAVEAAPWIHWTYAPQQWRGWIQAASQGSVSGRVRRALAAADPEVYFGEMGLFALGEFTPWMTVGVYLKAAFLDPREPRSLTLQFQKIVPGYATASLETKSVSLPLPQGDGVEADLARLQKELRNICRQATIALTSTVALTPSPGRPHGAPDATASSLIS